MALEFTRREYGIPYVAGGLLDQPFRRTTQARIAYNVYMAFKSYSDNTGGDAVWSTNNPDAWNIVSLIETNGLLDD